MVVVDEERLAGGNNALEVVRVGDTVRRARDGGAAFASRMLAYLESIGYPHAPHYLGIDEHGRDILSFIPGNTTDHPTQRAPGAYALGSRMLRDLHETTAGHALAAAAECVIHGDPGPFNTIFQKGLPVALIDWSSCRPGNRLDDLGYMAWTWCIQSQGRVPISQQAEHLRELRDGYGDVDSEHLLEAIVRRQTNIADVEAANLSNPKLTPTRRRHAQAAIAWATADRELVFQHKAVLLSALE
ncbi:phosphotransferase [Nonomuraea sp. NPDC052129]|uniref:phosphotransferase n=1 Tax=Nonomuraea sp. NPDC052129 TaxID=3154651 RepID=UPI0034124F3F